MNDDFPADEAPRDLLGDPVDLARDSWGRPEFEKTEEKQEVVRVLKAAGWSQERIARYLGCDVKTLRKHFSLELSLAADQAEAEALLTIHRRMKEGNVSAANRVLVLAEKGKAAPPQPKNQQPEDAPAPAADKLGKKERLEQAAKVPTGNWGDLLGKVH